MHPVDEPLGVAVGVHGGDLGRVGRQALERVLRPLLRVVLLCGKTAVTRPLLRGPGRSVLCKDEQRTRMMPRRNADVGYCRSALGMQHQVIRCASSAAIDFKTVTRPPVSAQHLQDVDDAEVVDLAPVAQVPVAPPHLHTPADMRIIISIILKNSLLGSDHKKRRPPHTQVLSHDLLVPSSRRRLQPPGQSALTWPVPLTPPSSEFHAERHSAACVSGGGGGASADSPAKGSDPWGARPESVSGQ
jgi:hypothetical protein